MIAAVSPDVDAKQPARDSDCRTSEDEPTREISLGCFGEALIYITTRHLAGIMVSHGHGSQ